MKMFWQRNQIINELRGQIVFAEITVNFLCINIGAVHDVGTSKEQRQGARHGGVPCRYPVVSGAAWPSDTPASPLGHFILSRHFGEPDASMWSQAMQVPRCRMHP